MAIQKTGLAEERRERLLTTLPDEHFPLERIKRNFVRMFPNAHIGEQGATIATATASSSSTAHKPTSFHPPPGRHWHGAIGRGRAAFVPEDGSEYAPDETPAQDPNSIPQIDPRSTLDPPQIRPKSPIDRP